MSNNANYQHPRLTLSRLPEYEQKLLTLLKERGACSKEAIVQHLEIAPSQVFQVLQPLEQRGQIRYLTNQNWGLTNK